METVNFEQLELSEPILRAVTEMGFEEASPIQAKAIPAQMEGLDIIGQAQTGTGKTAAFGIPLLQKIDPENKKFQAIILCPTRELAIQVSDEIRKLSKFMAGIKVYGNNRTGLLVDVTRIFTERQIDIDSVHSNTSKQGVATITLAFSIRGKEELQSLIDKIRQVESVIDVERTTG